MDESSSFLLLENQFPYGFPDALYRYGNRNRAAQYSVKHSKKRCLHNLWRTWKRRHDTTLVSSA